MPQGAKATTELFMGASFDRLRLRLPDPVPSPVGLANAGSPSTHGGRRFFLGLGEEGGGPIYQTGSARSLGRPQPRSASPKPPRPIEEGFLTPLAKIQATARFMCRGFFSIHLLPSPRHEKSCRGYQPPWNLRVLRCASCRASIGLNSGSTFCRTQAIANGSRHRWTCGQKNLLSKSVPGGER